MVIAIAILLGFVGLTGLLLAIEAFFRRNKASIDPKKFAGMKRMHFVRGISSFWFCAAGMLFLLTGYFGPIIVLVSVSGLLALSYALSRVNLHEFFDQLGK